MSERARSAVDERTDGPFDRVEDRSLWLPDLLAVAAAAAGLYAHGEFGVVAAAVLVVLWTRLRVEFVFAAGAVLLSGVGGSLVPFGAGSALALLGLGGLLAVDLARTWRSLRPVALFAGPFALAVVGVEYAGDGLSVPGHWLGVGVAAVLAVASYGLHRYELLRLGPGGPSGSDSDSGPAPDGERGEESVDDRPGGRETGRDDRRSEVA